MPYREGSVKKKVAIIQSNYIPWKGYFDIINFVDEFILYDDCQYTKRDWRNRNKIKTQSGVKWLTIPVKTKGSYFQKVKDVEVSDHSWVNQHLSSFRHFYSKAAYFNDYFEIIHNGYKNVADEVLLSNINYNLLLLICNILNINTKISFSMDYGVTENNATAKIVELCRKAEAQIYVSGPAASCYLDEKKFKTIGCSVHWFEYDHYPIYNQLSKPFDHHVSILDLIFNKGPQLFKYMKTFSFNRNLNF